MAETGTVRDWNADRAFGFIVRADGTHIFVHVSQLPTGTQNLVIGERVTFDVRTSPRNGKPEANNVEVERTSETPLLQKVNNGSRTDFLTVGKLAMGVCNETWADHR
jgi:cold shock CspA family protein